MRSSTVLRLAALSTSLAGSILPLNFCRSESPRRASPAFVSAGHVRAQSGQHASADEAGSLGRFFDAELVMPSPGPEPVGERPIVRLAKQNRPDLKGSMRRRKSDLSDPGRRKATRVLKMSGLLAASTALVFAVLKLVSCRARLATQKGRGRDNSSPSAGDQAKRRLAAGQPSAGVGGSSSGNCAAEEQDVATGLLAVQEQARLARIRELEELKSQKELFIAHNGYSAFLALQKAIRLGKIASPHLGYEYLVKYNYFGRWLGFVEFGEKEQEELDRLLREQRAFEVRKKAPEGTPV